MPSRSVRRLPAALALGVFLSALPLVAQCVPQWQPGDPRPVPAGAATATTTWDPDGTGPLAPVLLVGGGLLMASQTANGVLAYDGSAWTPLGDVGGTVTALTVFNGEPYAAVAATPSTIIRRWDGSAWQAIGVASGPVHAFTAFNNQIIAGGSFTSISGVAANRIATWNGTTWAPLGAGIASGGVVRALTVFTGTLRVGGTFTSAGGLSAGNFATWNGTSWITGPSFNGSVDVLTVRNSIAINGSLLFAAGAFTSYTVGGPAIAAQHIARFDPSTNSWSAVGTGVPGTRCTSLATRNVGLTGYEMLAGVEDASSSLHTYRYASGVWAALGAISNESGSVHPAAIGIFGGRYTVALNNSTTAVRAWDGTQWVPVTGRGFIGTVYAVEPSGSDLVVGGTFTTLDGVAVNGIARGSANAWVPLGTGVTGGIGVFALATAPNGDLFAAGEFTTAGGVPANRIARWDGSTWTPLGSGLGGTVLALLALPNGDLVAAGDFTIAGGVPASRIARWNGTTWAPLGSGLSARVNALARLPNGDIVAGGNFSLAGVQIVNRIARWNGASWSALGSGCNDSVFALATGPNGDLHVGGSFTTAGGLAGRLARWNHGVWSQSPAIGINTDILALAVHPNGDLFVGGGLFSFSLGPFGSWSSNLVRIRNGSSLSPMAVLGTTVQDIALPASDVAIGGVFTSVGPEVAVNVARFHAPCPALATVVGNGCNSQAGLLTLRAATLPWLNATYQAQAEPIPAGALAFDLVGFQPQATPLQLIHPAGMPNCAALVTAVSSQLVLPVNGIATTQLPIPNDPGLVGVTLLEQVLELELGATGLSRLAATNALQITIGVL